jgi:hypothetical protein
MRFPSPVERNKNFCERIRVHTDEAFSLSAADISRSPLTLRLAKKQKMPDTLLSVPAYALR